LLFIVRSCYDKNGIAAQTLFRRVKQLLEIHRGEFNGIWVPQGNT